MKTFARISLSSRSLAQADPRLIPRAREGRDLATKNTKGTEKGTMK